MTENVIKFETSHWGKRKINVEEFGYKALVITTPIQGKIEPSFGRLIQVRKNSGAFGSDCVLLRESDGKLRSYHNTGFFSVSDEYLSMYENAMKDVDEENFDDVSYSYSIQGDNEATGFIVEGLDDTNGESYSFGITIKKDILSL
jgi:hypothetical protein